MGRIHSHHQGSACMQTYPHQRAAANGALSSSRNVNGSGLETMQLHQEGPCSQHRTLEHSTRHYATSQGRPAMLKPVPTGWSMKSRSYFLFHLPAHSNTVAIRYREHIRRASSKHMQTA